MKIRFHTVTCSRCGGGGKYSWCARYGDTCFKCSGRGKVLSPAGSKASAALRAFYKSDPRFSVPVTDVKVGDTIMSGDTVLTAGCEVMSKRPRKVTVTKAEYSTYSDGEWATMHLEYTGDKLEPTGGSSWKLGGPVPRVFLPLSGALWEAYLDFATSLKKGVYFTADDGTFAGGDNPEAAAAKRAEASEKRRVASEARKARHAVAAAEMAERDKAVLDGLLTSEATRALLATKPHPKIPGKTALDYATWMAENAGPSMTLLKLRSVLDIEMIPMEGV